jgi:hypothetical protein
MISRSPHCRPSQRPAVHEGAADQARPRRRGGGDGVLDTVADLGMLAPLGEARQRVLGLAAPVSASMRPVSIIGGWR